MNDEGANNHEAYMEESLFLSVAKVKRKPIRLCKPLKRSIVVKLLGEKPNAEYFEKSSSEDHSASWRDENVDLENYYFLILFGDRSNVDHVFERGPSMIQGHNLVVQHEVTISIIRKMSFNYNCPF